MAFDEKTKYKWTTLLLKLSRNATRPHQISLTFHFLAGWFKGELLRGREISSPGSDTCVIKPHGSQGEIPKPALSVCMAAYSAAEDVVIKHWGTGEETETACSVL